MLSTFNKCYLFALLLLLIIIIFIDQKSQFLISLHSLFSVKPKSLTEYINIIIILSPQII